MFQSEAEFAAAMRALDPEAREAILAELEQMPTLAPQPGPQHRAYHHPAQITGFGGAAGGGKTHLLIMLAMQAHRRSVIYRADAEQIAAILYEFEQIIGSVAGRSIQNKRWHLPGGRYLEWAGLQALGAEAKRQGQPFDFIGFDEVTEIARHKVEFVRTWNRTTTRGQRVRTMMAFNPPGGKKNPAVDGRWIIDFFKCWIMQGYENPAQSGETRFFIKTPDDPDVEVADGEAVELEIDGQIKIVMPESRTFIQSRVQDNRYLAGTGYEQQLMALQPHLRAIYYDGDFSASIEDKEWQVIPSGWVDQAMGRWSKAKVRERPMSAMGVDVARGGSAQTLLAPRHGWHWDSFIKVPGRECIDGPAVRDRVMIERRDDCTVIVDANGNGSSAYDHLKSVERMPVIPSIGSTNTSREFLRLARVEDTFTFNNLRSLYLWLLRKVLDPANGLEATLPPDPRLRRQLIAPTFELRNGRLHVEPKELVEEQLGTTVDEMDGVMLSLGTAWEEEGFIRLLPTKRRRLENMRRMTPKAEENGKRAVYGRYVRRSFGGRGADPNLMM